MLTSFLRTSASSITWQACLPQCRAGSVRLLWECAWRILLFTNRKIDHTLYTASRPCRWHIHTGRLSQSSSSKVPIIFFMLPLSSRKSIQIHRNVYCSSGVQSGDIRMCSRHIFACQVCASRTHATSWTLRPQMLKVHSAQAYLSSIARPVAVSQHWVCVARRPLASPIKAAQGSGSYDSDSDELLREFQRYADPNKLQNATKRLELTWGVQRVGLLLAQTDCMTP